jgi:hypothetical protein
MFKKLTTQHKTHKIKTNFDPKCSYLGDSSALKNFNITQMICFLHRTLIKCLSCIGPGIPQGQQGR